MNVNVVNEKNKVAQVYENHTKVNSAYVNISGVDFVNAAVFDKSHDLKTAGNNTYSLKEDNQDKLKTVDDITDGATVLKNNLKALCNKMDMGELAGLDPEGDLEDIDVEKIVTVGEQIRIKLAAAGNDRVYTGDLDSETVKDVLGSISQMAADALCNNSYPVTDGNIEEIEQAVKTAKELEVCSTGEKAYLIKNKLDPTVENMYMANHSGSNQAESRNEGITDKEWTSLKPQIEKIISQEQIVQETADFEEIRQLIDENVAITPENILHLEKINEACDFVRGLKSSESDTSNRFTQKLVNKIVETMIDQKPAIGVNLSKDEVCWKKAVSLLEAKASMSFEAAYIMEKYGAAVDFSELSKEIEKLREYRGEVSAFVDQRTEEITGDIDRMKTAPCDAIARVVDFASLDNLSKISGELKADYEKAGKAYETMQTEVRPDLGDSVNKAVLAAAPSMLTNMGEADTYENKRAVNILVHNNMDVTLENLTKVKAIDDAVNNLFDKMKPSIVFDMLRDKVDVMGMNVEDLSAEIDKRIEQQEAVVNERFGEFLYRMEHKKMITEEEREQFMGLYTIVTKLTKDKGRASGLLAREGKEVTLGNLVTSFMSRNDAGMDIRIQEGSFSGNERQPEHNNAKLTYYKDLLSELSKVSSPACEMVAENNLPHTMNNLLAAGAFLENKNTFFRQLDKERTNAKLDAFLENMESREELSSKYEELTDYAKQLIENFQGEKSSADFKAVKILASGMGILESLSKNNTFYIPYEEESQTGAIKLTVVEGSEQKGQFSIEMETKEFGTVKVMARVNEDKIDASVSASNDSEEINTVKEKIYGALGQAGFKTVNLEEKTKVTTLEKGVTSKQSIKALFSAAKLFIECFR